MLARESESYFGKGSVVMELNPSHFDSKHSWKLLKKDCCVILFYAPWCPYCKAVKDTWEELAKKATNYEVYAFNCEKHKAHVSQIKEEVPYLVEGYPTIVLYKDGAPVKKLGQEDRNLSALMKVCVDGCKKGKK